jgi:hypothetical protein
MGQVVSVVLRALDHGPFCAKAGVVTSASVVTPAAIPAAMATLRRMVVSSSGPG